MTESHVYDDFVAVLGPDGVLANPAQLRAAQTATFHIGHRVALILRPASREQVQDCVRIASRHGVPLYPVSGGKNWGYGSRVPTADGSALLDLSRMKRIIDYSEKHAYITIEPGVTQAEVYDFLQRQGGKLILDCTGATPESSVIGNTLERGFGHTPYGDHFANVCNLEVVLASGECIRTGFGRFEDVAAAPTYRWGLGPVLDGLFSQSNFGIVTSLTAWLMPMPEYYQAFFFSCKRKNSLAPLIEALRPLRLDGTLKSASHIGNSYKVISGIQQYPWDLTHDTPLRGDALETLCREFDIGAWNGSGGLYGTKAQVAEARRLLQRAVKGNVDKLRFLDDRTLRLAERFAGPAKWITGWDMRRTLELVRPIFGLMKGIPTDYALRSVYWRKLTPVPQRMDPDRDRCGLIWCAPVAPTDGTHAERIATIATDVLLEHGFEPMLSITLLTERNLTCIVSISYDRDVEGEDARAMACYNHLVDALLAAGYHFYRLGIQSMSRIQQNNGYADLLVTLKRSLDPEGILAPGRYTGEPLGERATAEQDAT